MTRRAPDLAELSNAFLESIFVTQRDGSARYQSKDLSEAAEPPDQH